MPKKVWTKNGPKIVPLTADDEARRQEWRERVRPEAPERRALRALAEHVGPDAVEAVEAEIGPAPDGA